MLWSTIASAVIHLIVLTLLFYAVARVFVARGSREVVSQTKIVTIERAPPTPAPHRSVRHPVKARASSPAVVPRHELVKEVVARASPEPPLHRIVVPSRIQRDEAGYSREVAQLNAQNDPHAIPTIDPASRQSGTKSFAFEPSSTRGNAQGNGIITPTRSWRDRGLDCYYGRYEYNYPDGATESGNIAWPFCFDPGSDPFKEPPHPIPFPLPLDGFKLPADAELPPIEKAVYREWAASNGLSP
jgi:hypothetical protein